MEIDRQGGRLYRLHSLSQERKHHAGQHVAASALSHSVVARRIDISPSIRRRRDSGGPFQRQDAAVPFREAKRRPPAAQGQISAQIGELALVGRQNRHKSLLLPLPQKLLSVLHRVQAVRVQHQGNRRLLQQLADQKRQLLAPPKPRPNQARVTGIQPFQNLKERPGGNSAVLIRKRRRHHLQTGSRRNRVNALRNAKENQAASAAGRSP